ncbi:tRNA (adenosine(37)-N6)-dimethylallyltransferase MiaA [Filifactor villosus]|uniref:tRNA dimethylallyltransferase n=1 Tax=Filifactor villosus TaxID=29374 RepID=A0ABV9QKA4_9FIRM
MKKVIMIVGPTAVGKTFVSVEAAKRLDAEIISADSMQIYRNMDIGTAKIREDEKQGVTHHLIDIVDADESFTAAQYQTKALSCIDDIFARGRVPIVVGGTGLYINSLLYDMDFQSGVSDEELRSSLWELYDKEGEEALFLKLRQLDPKKAEKIDRKNIKRVIRAIEIATYKDKNRDFSSDCPLREGYRFFLFVLTSPRTLLYERINERVLRMLDEGLVDEVSALISRFPLTRESQSMMGIGYRQVISYLENEMTEEEMIEEVQKQSRRYAKRQLTWFKRYPQASWIEITNLSEEGEEVVDKIVNTFRSS